MAANDYFHAPAPNRIPSQRDHHQSSSPTAPSPPAKPPTSLYTNYQPSQTSYNPSPYSAADSPSETRHPWRDSQHSGATVGATSYDERQYADNIPLKSSQARPYSDGNPGGSNTQYPPPSPESQRPSRSRTRSKKKKKKQGWFRGQITWVVFAVTLVQTGVFIAELATNARKIGSPIMTRPTVNPMIGPSPYVLIHMGARFVPCMRETDGTEGLDFPCPESVTNEPSDKLNHCTLPQLCGLGAADDGSQPRQWYRFITPMFMHAGIIHIGFNMLLQLTLGRDMELAIGSLRFALVYFSAGIFGFVLGGNFAPPAIASTGASGSLFGIFALVLLDLVYSWKERSRPLRELLIIVLQIVIAFVLGLLPGLDNFSHIGGFLMGLVLGICILHSPNLLRQRIGMASVPYQPMASSRDSKETGAATFAKRPKEFFKGRQPAWWAWWLIRVGALMGVLVAFIVLLNNFYVYKNECSWCKHLSCLPINDWCDIGFFEAVKNP